MANSLVGKLRIRPGESLLTINAPSGFAKTLGTLPAGVKITDKGSAFDQVHWFVLNSKQLEKEMSRIMKLLKPGVMVWVYYPKGSSGIQTDLTRDKGWDCLLEEEEKLAWVNLISFDDTWSAFGFRAKTEADRKRDARPKKEREIFQWADPVSKTVRVPEDLATALRRKKKLNEYFQSLAFSHKREYVEWIIEAKRDETRKKRIDGTIERLEKGWKNPRNI
jgi:hypothetical protein